MPIDAEVTVDYFLLREGPGRMFPTVYMYDTGARVTLVAREPGNNWVLVQTQDFKSGWMHVDYLSFTGDVTPLPVMKVPNAQVLHGRVWNVNKTPATKIGVSIARVTEPQPCSRGCVYDKFKWRMVSLPAAGILPAIGWSERIHTLIKVMRSIPTGNLIGKWPGAQVITCLCRQMSAWNSHSKK